MTKVDFSKLSEREFLYYSIMKAKSGVLYITAKPGVAKSAIALSVAKKTEHAYFDVRLSMADETDFKFPHLVDVQDGDRTRKVSEYAIPKWAYDANQRPTIIHFEELNRAPLFVRNAALQILLERKIGDFEFNDNVLMMASGNLGDEDGTDVEEFDAALNNRLIHYPHVLTTKEWIEGYAEKNVHPLITGYIKAYPEELYKSNENSKAYATPRSWTFLSNFIKENFAPVDGKESPLSTIKPVLDKIANAYIGGSAVKFLKYCNDLITLTLDDVLNDFESAHEQLKKFNRDKKAELIQSLTQRDIKKMTDNQLDNAAKFLNILAEEEKTKYLLHVLDNVTDVNDPRIKKFLQKFKDTLLVIKKINKPGK